MILSKSFIMVFFSMYLSTLPLLTKAQRIASDSTTSKNSTRSVFPISITNKLKTYRGSQSSIFHLLTPFASNSKTNAKTDGTTFPFFGPQSTEKRLTPIPFENSNNSFVLWDPVFASFFNRFIDSDTFYDENEVVSHLSKPFLGKDSFISGLFETTPSWVPSNTQRNVIISYKNFKPFLGVEGLLQRTTFLKSIWDTIKTGIPIRSIYLQNLGMELMEVPDIFRVSEFVQILLSHNKIVGNVFQDTEIGFPDVPRKLNYVNGQVEKTFQKISFHGSQQENVSSTSKAQKNGKNRRLVSKKIPNDTDFNNQWAFIDTGVSKWGVEMQQAWDVWTAEELQEKFIIALIDSGVDYNHPDLRENIWKNEAEICNNGIDDDNNGLIDDCLGWDFVNNNNNPLDDNGHGTASAGILAAESNNGLGVAGMCWGCQLMVLKALNHEIKGTVSGFVRAIDYALGKGAKLSSNSYGGRGSEFSALHEAVLRAKQQGMIFVTAAGNYQENNDNDKNPVYPASYDLDNIISVAAITRQGRLADFSSYGRNSVDVAAPGERIFSTFTGGGYRFVDGTSFAVPFVTGTAALIWSSNPTLAYREVISQIIQYQRVSPYLKDLTRTSGVLNVWAALTKNGTSTGAVGHTPTCEEKNPCDTNAVCTDGSSGSQCHCKPGFNGNGGQCQDIDECNYHPCGKVSTCHNKVGSFECRCIAGFKRVNDFCEDINECSSAAACPLEARCANFAGTHDCFCPSGHFWNAKEGKDGRCAPLCKLICDSAQNGVCFQNGNCGINSICKSQRTFWFYTSSCECLPGYTRDTTTQTCVRDGLLRMQTQEYIEAVPNLKSDYQKQKSIECHTTRHFNIW
ncbi:subtilisin SUB7, partial [Cardiosporidium cionae]